MALVFLPRLLTSRQNKAGPFSPTTSASPASSEKRLPVSEGKMVEIRAHLCLSSRTSSRQASITPNVRRLFQTIGSFSTRSPTHFRAITRPDVHQVPQSWAQIEAAIPRDHDLRMQYNLRASDDIVLAQVYASQSHFQLVCGASTRTLWWRCWAPIARTGGRCPSDMRWPFAAARLSWCTGDWAETRFAVKPAA